MREFIQGMYQKPHFWKRMLFCFLAVCIMGFGVSWLNLIHLGTDPYSVMNLAIAERIHMSYGNWLVIFNTVLFVIVIVKDHSKIGFGTLFNMICVGYACDFMTWLRQRLWPQLTLESMSLGLRLVLMVVMLAMFILAVAVYMSVDLGTAPYDAMPFIIADAKEQFSFRVVRMIWECAVTVIGFAIGGVVGIVTIIMAFAIGPVAAWVSRHIQRFFEEK